MRNIGKSIKGVFSWLPKPLERFAFESGERQTASTLEQIRLDHRARYELAVKWIADRFPDPTVLTGADVFCGNGYGSFQVSSQLGCFMLGIDASAGAIDCANTHFSNLKTMFVHKVFPFKLPEETVDFVICFESLEHIREDEALLIELAGMLKPGGLLFLSTPNEDLFPHHPESTPFHITHYTLEDILEIAGNTTALRLLSWYGQDLYRFLDSKKKIALPEEEMVLRKEEPGQLTVFVFER